MIVKKEKDGYFVYRKRKSSLGRSGGRRNPHYISRFFVRYSSDIKSKQGNLTFGSSLMLPKELIGKHVRIKIEVIKDENPKN